MTTLIVGFRDLTLEGARELVEARLGITMVPHDSSFHGGDYYAFRGSRDEKFILQVNFDSCFDGDWAEPRARGLSDRDVRGLHATSPGDRERQLSAGAHTARARR